MRMCSRSKSRRHRNRAIALAALATCAPASALAQSVAADGSPSEIRLALPVTASVASQCGFASGAAPNGAYSAPNLYSAFAHDFAFRLACNVPLRVAVVSANGGLLSPDGGIGAGYTNLAPYTVALNLTGNAGVTSVSAACAARDLSAAAATPCSFRGPASPARGLLLNGASNQDAESYLRVSAAAYADSGDGILVASPVYADTLTVSISASL
jgi:hypothetical protein